MSYPTIRPTRTTQLAAILASAAFLGACSPHRTTGITQSENLMMLQEINLGPSFTSNSEFLASTEGPNLIAGDWLAIQCAAVGGYLDNFHEDQSSSPVYANVEADD